MRIPIRNKGDRPLTVFIELQCDQFEVPVGGEAIVRLADGRPHSVDVDDAWVTIWDEEGDASVEVISSSDKRVDEALMLARVWLHRLGADEEALLIDAAVDQFEISVGYLAARKQVFCAFHDGFLNRVSALSDDATLTACYLAGTNAARLNEAARKAKSFPELGCAPFDTDTARSVFARALDNVC
ncbi:hypothetical protein [Sphingomonas montana]|uniref:hypothetical protein n=1 Tax=Sphingomonas montana TaxID=1843236 RepID=UPI00101ADF83|nr:hypothetical protein [Sphingomonas montana]